MLLSKTTWRRAFLARFSKHNITKNKIVLGNGVLRDGSTDVRG